MQADEHTDGCVYWSPRTRLLTLRDTEGNLSILGIRTEIQARDFAEEHNFYFEVLKPKRKRR